MVYKEVPDQLILSGLKSVSSHHPLLSCSALCLQIHREHLAKPIQGSYTRSQAAEAPADVLSTLSECESLDSPHPLARVNLDEHVNRYTEIYLVWSNQPAALPTLAYK